jgi:hypothetical protein
VSHFYVGSPDLGRPRRDRFVIFIEAAVHMHERLARLAGGLLGLRSPRESRAPASRGPSPPPQLAVGVHRVRMAHGFEHREICDRVAVREAVCERIPAVGG